VSPPTGLRLRWRSVPGGDWRMRLEVSAHAAREFKFEGDALTFWCFSDFEITAASAPLIYLLDKKNFGTPSIPLVRGDERIPAGRWVLVQLPFAAFAQTLFRDTRDRTFDPQNLRSISFVAAPRRRPRAHALPRRFSGARCEPARRRSAARAHGNRRARFRAPHRRELARERCARRARVSHLPLGGRPRLRAGRHAAGTRTRFADFVGAPPHTAHYRVTALDVTGHESPPSPVAQASTRAFSDDELLEMTQAACFRYYWEAAHPLAGLAPEILPGDTDLVPLGGNGFGVMALLVAAERGFVPREQAAERLLKIVRFSRAPTVFMAHGRTSSTAAPATSPRSLANTTTAPISLKRRS